MMKIVKLNRRHKALSEGFTHALRFEYYDHAVVQKIETSLSDKYGYSGWKREDAGDWYSMFGNVAKAKNGSKYKTYWVYLRNEADVTLLLLLGLV